MRLRLVLLLVACCGAALGWVVHGRRHRLADDSSEFYSHEEWAEYQAFLEAVATRHARVAEEKADAGGADASRWAREAARDERGLPLTRRSSENTGGGRASNEMAGRREV